MNILHKIFWKILSVAELCKKIGDVFLGYWDLFIGLEAIMLSR